MNTSTEWKELRLRLPLDTHRRLRVQAAEEGVSLADLVRSLLSSPPAAEKEREVKRVASAVPVTKTSSSDRQMVGKVPDIPGLQPASSICAHKDYRVVNGGWRVCNGCSKTSSDLGRSWR